MPKYPFRGKLTKAQRLLLLLATMITILKKNTCLCT